ncbi:MAG: PCRF domain-containing protein, partial [Clostridia bacterium]|nr:PCRF domain-containing protein [Clostridia bacterium]
MIQIEDLKLTIKALQSKLAIIGESLNIPKLTEELDALNEQQHAPDFWNDVKNAQQVSQRAKNIEYKIENYNKLCASLNDVADLLDMAGEDESILGDSANELTNLEKQISELH